MPLPINNGTQSPCVSISSNYKIYGLKDPITEQIRYIGYTKRDNLDVRLKEHLTIDCKFHKGHWILNLRKNDLTPIIELIEDHISKEEIQSKEIFYIKLFKSLGAKLTNMNDGGVGGLGFNHSEETKQKLSLNRKGKPRCDGYIHNEEMRKSISERTIGEKNPFYGKKHSEEVMLKIKEARSKQIMISGWAHTDETKVKISLAKKGLKRTETEKLNLSLKLKGRVFTEDHKTKLKESWLKRKLNKIEYAAC